MYVIIFVILYADIPFDSTYTWKICDHEFAVVLKSIILVVTKKICCKHNRKELVDFVEGNHRPIATSDNIFGRLLNNLPRTDYLGLTLIPAINK